MAKKEIEVIRPGIFDTLYFFFLILLPFVYSDKIIDPVLIPRQIYLTCFVFIVGLIISYKIYKKELLADFSFIKLSLPLLILGFLLINIISGFQSIAITESIYVWSKLTVELLFFIITTYLIIQNELDVRHLIKSVVVFSIISVIMAIFQILPLYFSTNTLIRNNVNLITSTYANKNLLSSILFLTLPFIISATASSKGWKITSFILFPIVIILLLVIKTKAVILALIIASILFFILFIRKGGKKTQFLLGLLLVSILIIGFVVYQNKIYFSSLTNTNTAIERLRLWKNSFEMIKENPVLGVGAENWQIHFPKFGLDKFDSGVIQNGIQTFQRPHNDFLWVFSETGVFGFLIYTFIFGVILFYLLRLLNHEKSEEDKRLYSILFAGIVGYIFISLVDFPLERIEHQVLLYLTFSIVLAHYYRIFHISTTSKKTILKIPLFVTLLFIPILFSFVVSTKRCSGEYHTKKLYSFRGQSNWSQVIKEADKATSFYYSLDPTSAPIEWYKGVALFSMGDIPMAKMSFEKAYSIHPYNIHVLNNLASCYESLKEHKKAEVFYLKALSISSEFEEARLNLSAAYFNDGQYEKAFEMIDGCKANSKDAKYKIFLPVILNSWLDNVFGKRMDTDLIKTKVDIGSNDKLVKFYFDSKKKGVKFDKYLLKVVR